jgi:hypothetical protein
MLFRVITKVLLNESRIETIKASRHGGMRREEISDPSGGQRDLEGLIVLLHEITSPFQDRKCGVPFIQMANFGLDAESPQQAPPSNAKQQFLFETQFGASTIKLTGNSAMSGIVRGIIAIQKIKPPSANLNLPGAQPN